MADPNVIPAAVGAGIDPEWEKFQRENEEARKANRARKIERALPPPTSGTGPPGQGYRPYGSDPGDRYQGGGNVGAPRPSPYENVGDPRPSPYGNVAAGPIAANAATSVPAAPAAPAPPARDPRQQLSAEYWDRVRRNAAVQRAATPDAAPLDAKARTINELVAPPGPQPGAPAGAAYRRGGIIRKPTFAHGGPVLNAKDYSKGKM